MSRPTISHAEEPDHPVYAIEDRAPVTSGLAVVAAKVLAREFPHESAARMAHVAAEVTNALTTGVVLVDRDTLDQWIEDALTQGIAPAAYVFGVLSAALPEEKP